MAQHPYEIKFNGHEFDPVPKVTIENIYNTTDPGSYLYTEEVITLEGSVTGCLTRDIMANASGLAKKLNYPDSDETKGFHFKGDNYYLYPDPTPATVKSFEFKMPDISQSFHKIDYTVVLSIISYASGMNSLTKHETDINKRPAVSSATDNYSLEISDEKFVSMTGEIIPLMKLTRNIGAVGLQYNNKPPIWHAQKWIKDRQDKSSITGIDALKNWSYYNHDRKIDEDLVKGGYSVTDTFLVSPVPISGGLHNYTIEFSQDTQSDLQIVKVKGEIKGLEPANTGNEIYKDFILPNDSPSSYYNDHIKPTVSGVGTPTPTQTVAYDNAYALYTGLAFTGIFWLAQEEKDKIDQYLNNVSDYKLQYIPISINEGFNAKTASISYEYSYNNRSDTWLKGALVESFSISNSSGVPVKKYKHNVIGKQGGPLIFWHSDSSGISTKTISYEAILPPYTGLLRYSYSQAIKNEVYNIVIGPITGMLGIAQGATKKGYIESYDTVHNLGSNSINATLKFVYNEKCY